MKGDFWKKTWQGILILALLGRAVFSLTKVYSWTHSKIYHLICRIPCEIWMQNKHHSFCVLLLKDLFGFPPTVGSFLTCIHSFGKKTKLVVQRGDFSPPPDSERQNKNCDCFFESTIKDFILPTDFWSCRRRKNPIAYCCSSSGNLFGWFGHYECLKMLCCPFMQSAVSRLSPPLLVLSKETGRGRREGEFLPYFQ